MNTADKSINIYNSRNYKCLLDICPPGCQLLIIYNSRNYKCLLDHNRKRGRIATSTIVEIINVC